MSKTPLDAIIAVRIATFLIRHNLFSFLVRRLNKHFYSRTGIDKYIEVH